ncbi:MAG: 30S ribosome-binding factor RbfA [Acidimicrobiales bacterium]
MSKRRRNSPRDYPRSARLNELLREILASELERIDDEHLGWVSISGVDVDNELTRARVFISALDAEAAAVAVDVLYEERGRLRKAIGEQARLRKVPDLVFSVDPAINSGGRVEQILAELRDADDPQP